MNLEPILTPFINYHRTDLDSTKKRLSKKKTEKNENNINGFIYFFPQSKFTNFSTTLKSILEEHTHEKLKWHLLSDPKKTLLFLGLKGPVWIFFLNEIDENKNKNDHGGYLNESAYANSRDQAGAIISQLNQYKNLKEKHIAVHFAAGLSKECVTGFIVGSELASYNYLQVQKNGDEKSKTLRTTHFYISGKCTDADLELALSLSRATNLARHLVNLPPNLVNPTSMQKITETLPFSKKTSIEVWNQERCKKENMNLLLAVGSGSKDQPRLIHLKYRPAGVKKTASAKTKKPIAFVGKGITFDTGGLDIKPSSGMRLMKKDMGGSAAVLALALWVDQVGYSRPCDFYLALAENAVDAYSMRPSDVYKSRAGYLVEIDNTDAEGRLVLADALDVAVTQKDEPEYVINIATLTGAIKVALGADVAGLFCNDEKMSEQLMHAGQAAGEPNWRMPLVKKYWNSLNSNFADFKNSADGFGGAITAALFLEKFIGSKKWAHLDVYSWTDKSTGALSAGAANGQPVQSMANWLHTVE